MSLSKVPAERACTLDAEKATRTSSPHRQPERVAVCWRIRRKRERGIRKQINHEFMPLFVFSFCSPPPVLHRCWHDGAFLRRAIIKTLGRRDASTSPPVPRFSRRLRPLSRVRRSHKEVILALQFIYSELYAGFTSLGTPRWK